MKVILASKSPRRRQLLEQIGWEPQVVTAPVSEAANALYVHQALLKNIELREILRPFLETDGQCGPAVIAAFNAYCKGCTASKHMEAVAKKYGLGLSAVPRGKTLPVVAADTLVTNGTYIFGKPKDEEEAMQMLLALSGKWHEVKTGIAIFYRHKSVVNVVTTKVHFRRLSRERLAAYVATGEPMDKAGAYGIQGRGALLVDKITGSYSNVVGLPLAELDKMVCKMLVGFSKKKEDDRSKI